MDLSRLRALDPREVWAHEAHDFTPWLLSNADALAEVLGIDIELTANEHPVGGFALDLIGRDLTNDCVLIVENQLAPTDHSHLGQILTYSAGTDAKTIVWMATSFREEHRQALDWLNALAEGNARFFGVEIGVVRIADSPPAPLFKVRAQPNDWQAQVAVATKASAQVSGKAALYLQFWTRYLERVSAERPGWTSARKPVAQNWFDMPSPFKGGPRYSQSFASHDRLKSELYIDYAQPDQVGDLYGFLLERQDQIEDLYGGRLSWEELPGRRASRVADYTDGDVTDEERHDDFIDWLFDSGTRLRVALARVAEEWTSQNRLAVEATEWAQRGRPGI